MPRVRAHAESRWPFRGRTPRLRLPILFSCEIIRVQYESPRVRLRGMERIEHREAVEIAIETSEALAPRPRSPVLSVGDRIVCDYEVEGRNRYRFFLFDFEGIEEGAPIRLVWPQAPGRRQPARFTFSAAVRARRP